MADLMPSEIGRHLLGVQARTLRCAQARYIADIASAEWAFA